MHINTHKSYYLAVMLGIYFFLKCSIRADPILYMYAAFSVIMGKSLLRRQFDTHHILSTFTRFLAYLASKFKHSYTVGYKCSPNICM